MTGHTPWHVYHDLQHDFVYVVDTDSKKLATVYGTLGSKMERADLFAAAPEIAAERDRLREINAELLEAAQNLIEFLEKSVNAGPISNKPKPERLLLACLRTAIAKATGETS